MMMYIDNFFFVEEMQFESFLEEERPSVAFFTISYPKR